MADAFASTPGSHVRRDDASANRREPADREAAHRLVAMHRTGVIDLYAPLRADETNVLARDLWTQEFREAIRWRDYAHWQSSRSYYPALPSFDPPAELAQWSPAMRQRHLLEDKYQRLVTNRAEVHRLEAAQTDVYSSRRSVA